MADSVTDETESKPGSVDLVRRFGARHLGTLAVLAIVALVFASVQLLKARATEVPLDPHLPSAGSSAPPSESATPTPSTVARLTVHVVGQVKRPGLVTLTAGSRVGDAIEAAGGLTDRARLGTLNLAAVLVDGVQVVVGPHDGQESSVGGAVAVSGGPATAGAPVSGALLDLNTATAEQFEQLPGVGPVTAANIVAWREKNGRFTSVAELQEVDGIGPKTYQRLAPLVRV